VAYEDSLSRVAVVISTFRSDASVIALLRQAFAGDTCPFGAVIVVDSQGSGTIQEAIQREGWKVDYHNFQTNLGSAGNLAQRFDLAASKDVDWCYALNHDGRLDPNLIRRLLSHAEEGERIGAAYPRLVYPNAGGKEDRARRSLSPFSAFELSPNDEASCFEVAWSSSNGALYNLAAIRGGVTIWTELWFGWEDFALGWQLAAAGWRQILCNNLRLEDCYEFRRASLFGRAVYFADKPVWYSYYMLRNLLIIRRRSGAQAIGIFMIAKRCFIECLSTLLFRSQKRDRLNLLFQGLRDGFCGAIGKGPVP